MVVPPDWEGFGCDFVVPETLDEVCLDQFGEYDDAGSYSFAVGAPFFDDVKIITGTSIFGRNKPTKVKTSADELLALASSDDKRAAEELLKAVDPQLLELLVDYMIPSSMEDIFDPKNPKNKLRKQFLQLGPSVGTIHRVGSVFLASGDSDGCLKLLDADGNKLMQGSPSNIMQYAIQFCREDVAGLYRQIRQIPIKGKPTFENYRNMLKYYRAERELSGTVNRLSKISQLGKVDADNPYFWFSELDVEEPVWFVGSTDWRSKIRFKNIVDANDSVLLADVVIGDQDGAVRNDWGRLNELMCDGREIMVHCVMDDGMQELRGVVVNKPRPHNLACVVSLGDCHPKLGDFSERFFSDVEAANEWRNGRFFGFTPPSEPNYTLGFQDYILDLFGCDDSVVPDVAVPVPPSAGRWARAEERVEAVRDIFKDRDFPFLDVEPIPGQFVTVYSNLGLMASPSIPPFLQASLIMAQARRDGHVYYADGRWRVKRRKKK